MFIDKKKALELLKEGAEMRATEAHRARILYIEKLQENPDTSIRSLINWLEAEKRYEEAAKLVEDFINRTED